MAASTWASSEIDARIIALKQTKGLSHTTIAAAICHEFKVFVNKNMVLRRARTVMGIDRGEKAANERLERKRAAERAALEPRAPKTRPMGMPPPVVTLPPLPSGVGYGVLGFHYMIEEAPPPPTPAPLGNGKCAFPLWSNGAPVSHEYCNKRTPLGSSWCATHHAVVYHRVSRAA